MTSIKQPGKQMDSYQTHTSSLPALTISETTPNDLPVLTEIVIESDTELPRVLSEEEIQQLLRRLEASIEIMFTQKLSLQLEQMQRQAIDQALDELKAKLPELLQDALSAHHDSR